MDCPKCTQVDYHYQGEGHLFISTPTPHTKSKIKQVLGNTVQLIDADNEVLHINDEADVIAQTLPELSETLSDEEKQDTKAAWSQNEEVSISILTNMTPISEFIGRMNGRYLVDIIQEKRLINEYQPIVPASNTARPYGYELLVRGEDNNQDIISPGTLFPDAKKANRLFELDRAARETAVKNTQKINFDQKAFINFLPTSIYDPSYCLQTTFDAIQKYNVRKEQLVFEVVETESIDDIDNLIDILSTYRNQGISIALDDFGTGYSSLNLLSKLKPEYIKLDRSLVQNFQKSKLKQKLAQNILDTAQDCGITTIAEGIATKAQANWFIGNGADLLQGYYYARPSSAPVKSV